MRVVYNCTLWSHVSEELFLLGLYVMFFFIATHVVVKQFALASLA